MNLTSRTLLIIDDSSEDRELYRRYLLRDQDYAYTILEASLGRQGLDLWHQHHPDAVLLDYQLPDLDGLEFLAHLQSALPQPCLPIIMVTGQGNEAIAVQAMKAGAQDYLVKEQITPEGLHLAVNGAIETVQLRTQLQQRIERERIVGQITQQIYQTLDFDRILQTTVTEVRQFLQTDRVLVFQLQPDGNGTVIAESVGGAWQSLLASSIYDPCLAENHLRLSRPKSLNLDPAFAEDYIKRYHQGQVTAISDIHNSDIDPCHIELLAQFQVNANLVVPILHDDRFWGLLIAHHCKAPRFWEPLEIDLLQELATQMGIALHQAELYQQSQSELAERHRVEAELRESERQLRIAKDAAALGIHDYDVTSGAIQWDSRVLELWGVGSDEPITHEVFISGLHPEDRAANQAAVNRALDLTGDGKYYSEYRVIHRTDGMTRWIAATGIVFFEHERAVRLVGTVQDITDRKLAERERDRLLEQEQAARAEAERANRIKDEFLAVLSHELRSPLNPILGWAKLLQSRKFDATITNEALVTIERNAKLQAQLIDDLLDVAKILRGKLSMNVAPVDLAFVIEQAIDTVRTASVAKNITLHAELPQMGRVSGDAARLQQIVWNLLSNAIKFTPTQGRVDIRLERVGNQAQIMVSDSGKGINPDFLPHIFESFRQEDASTTRTYGGLGLGLAIVRHLVEDHGGTIYADSPGEGQGATFTVQLPLLDAEPEQPTSEAVSSDELDLTGVRILTVDDEPDARELLAALLTQYGAEVLTVTSAAEVLTHLESFQPDVLISDIGMPDVDGYMLIQQIRALPPEKGGQTLAIALTAYAREEDYQQAINNGYQRHLTKPLDLDQLVQVVVELTRHAI